jgi:hypothetical protein
MGKVKSMLMEEYEQAFPYEQEYNLWIASMERDYQEEVEYRASLAVTNRTNIVLHKEEYSPYITINS